MNYQQHQQVFKNGLIRNNFLGHYLTEFLYRKINKDVAKKQYEKTRSTWLYS